ncbi:hypothetical protein LZ30DRAFT_179115 [Colletotrichum cereale]|nr:hypothetical protein LZ30DRAFT_179115 [Colletotrichum cereale]
MTHGWKRFVLQDPPSQYRAFKRSRPRHDPCRAVLCRFSGDISLCHVNASPQPRTSIPPSPPSQTPLTEAAAALLTATSYQISHPPKGNRGICPRRSGGGGHARVARSAHLDLAGIPEPLNPSTSAVDLVDRRGTKTGPGSGPSVEVTARMTSQPTELPANESPRCFGLETAAGGLVLLASTGVLDGPGDSSDHAILQC